MTDTDDGSHDNTQHQENHGRRRVRVLLGITGSVAAIKGPELAVRMVEEIGVDVKIILTRGGENFWIKAQAYHPQSWDKLQKLLLLSPPKGEPNHDPHISIHCKQICQV
jgi:hypothetical protein